MKLYQKLSIIGAACIAVAGFVYSQIYIHEKSREELLGIAEELARTWQQKIKLTEIQVLQLIDVIIEFTIKKNEIINSSMKQSEKIYSLKNIQKNEYKQVKKFMSAKQLEDYIGINQDITEKV